VGRRLIFNQQENDMPKFEIRLSRNKKYYFVLIAANGKIILQSELYEKKQGAITGIDSVKQNAFADVVDESSKYHHRRIK
jgi:uncharacterized protein YegP (UPF0339 family)